MHSIRKFAISALLSAAILAASPALAQTPTQAPFFTGGQTSIFPNFSYAAQTFTATAQTGAAVGLPGLSSGLIEVKGTTLTTATFAVQGSIDGGVTYFPLLTMAVNAIATPVLPLTVVAYTQTATVAAGTLYAVNLAGITNVRFVTSSTFTGTGVTIKLTGSANKGLL